MKYFSLFSGIGGFELGIQQSHVDAPISPRGKQGRVDMAGSNTADDGQQVVAQQPHTCVGFSEIDKYAIQIYQKHFPEHKNYGDITKIKTEDLPDFECLVGGFPCQSFSIAGKRRGFDDTRGTLFFDIARILEAKQPTLFVLENVKGLLSHDNGRTFKTIIATLDELGYDLQWQVLNSKNFGVPQNRERVYIVGHLRGTPRPEVFPFGEDGGTADGVSGHVANTLTARYEGAQAVGTYIGESELNAQETETGGSGVLEKGNQPDNKDGDGWSTHSEHTRIRRLTPLECERLQGFPDNWTDCVSDTQRYKCCGNAVTVNVVREIMKKLL